MKKTYLFSVALIATTLILSGCGPAITDDKPKSETTDVPKNNTEQTPATTSTENNETPASGTPTTTEGGTTTSGTQAPGNTGPMLPANGSGTGPYRVFTGNGMIAVDMGDPSQKLYTITDKTIRGAKAVSHTTVNTDNKTIDGVITTYVVFVADDRLWKTDLRLGSNLAMTQISSALMANACTNYQDEIELSTHSSSDIAPDSADVVWHTGGSDGKCNTIADNQWFRAKLSDDSSTQPTTTIDPSITESDRELFDPQNRLAGPTEILSVEGKVLKSYDKNRANPSVVATATTSVSIWYLGGSWISGQAGDGIMVQIDNNVRWYARGSKALSAPLLSPGTGNQISAHENDRTAFFVAVTNSTSRDVSIYRLSADGTSSGQLVAANVGKISATSSEIPQYGFQFRAITNNYIFYTTKLIDTINPTGQTQIYRLAKNGGTPLLVTTGLSSYNVTVVLPLDTTRMLVNAVDTQNLNHGLIINEDGLVLNAFDDASAIGFKYGFMQTNGVQYLGFDRIVLITNYSAALAGTEGAKLQVYDVDAGSLGIVLGQLPLNTLGGLSGFQNKLIANFYSTDKSKSQPVSQFDVYYIDLTTENSLRQLTTTLTQNERIIQ